VINRAKESMYCTKYTYKFKPEIPMDAVKDSLLLAVMAVEGLKGRTRIQLEARFRLDRIERSCVIDANTVVGDSIARIFTRFLAKEFGEQAFKVKRADSSIETSSSDEDHEISTTCSHRQADAS